MAELIVQDLSVSIGSTAILSDVNFVLESGRIGVLVGASGSGKTTLLRSLAGFVSSDVGSIKINGKTVNEFREDQPGGIGFVFQDYALFEHLTVRQNIEYGCQTTTHFEGVKELIDILGLGSHLDKKIVEISGGEKQRVALARALAVRPSVLLLDEPFGSLDPWLRKKLRGEFLSLFHKFGTTVLLVTHDLQSASLMAHKVFFMSKGELVKEGVFSSFYGDDRSPEIQSFFGNGTWVEGEIENQVFRSSNTKIRLPQVQEQEGKARVLIRNPESLYFDSKPIKK